MKSQRAINSFSKGIDRDTSVNKYSEHTYYDALNMRLITNDPLTAGAMTNVPGTSLLLNFALNDVIIGVCPVRNTYNDTDKDSVIFFATNASGVDSIYLLEADGDRLTAPIEMNQSYQIVGAGDTAYKAGYIYRGTDLNFSEEHRIKSESRYESAIIKKLYWVDGVNPIRYMNISTVETLILGGGSVSSANLFEINPDVELSTPITNVLSGGSYTAGIVQHSYQLYVKNGTKSAYSPLSNYVNLSSSNFAADTKNITGDDLNTNTGNSVQINIEDLDLNFNRIRIVALHYTQVNLSPTVKIIGEFEYTTSSINIIDSGINDYGTIEISEFRLQSQINYSADSLASKNNIMFYANLTEDIWNPSWLDPLDSNFFDTRAVRFKNSTNEAAGTDEVTKGFFDDSPNTDSDYMRSMYADDNTIVLHITDFTTWGEVPTGRVVTTVDSVLADRLVVRYSLAGIPRTYISPVGGITISLGGTAVHPIVEIVDAAGMFISSYDPMTDYIIETSFFSTTLGGGTFEYSYTSAEEAIISAMVHDSGVSGGLTIGTTFAEWSSYQYSHDGINLYNDIDNDEDTSKKYIYQSDGNTLGAEGPNLKIEFVTETLPIDNFSSLYNANLTSKENTSFDTSHRSSQRTEVYRMYIVFFNQKMQYSSPQWICDIRMPSINDAAYLNILNITGTSNAVYLYPKVTLLNTPADSDVVGWQIFRCERSSIDRSVLATGVLSKVGYIAADDLYQPYSSATEMLIKAEDSITDHERIIEFISPEISFNRNISLRSGDKLRIDGRYSGTLTRTALAGGYNVGSLKLTNTKARDIADNIYNIINNAVIEETQTADADDIVTHVYNGVTYKNWVSFTVPNSYHGQKGTTLIISLTEDIGMAAATTGWGYGSYVRNVFQTQYNGYTYEARSYNRVIPYSDFTPIDIDNTTCYYGDIFISYFAYLRTMYPTANVSPDYVIEELVLVPCETSINNFYRTDPFMEYVGYLSSASHTHIQEKLTDGLSFWPIEYPSDIGDLYRYNSAYSAALNALTIQAKIFDSVSIEENPFKIIASDKKINNEYLDSWLTLRVNNSIELEGKYGDINNIINFGNKFFAFQNKAVSLVSINDRSLIQDTSGLPLTLGTGDILARYDYMTTSSGIAKHTDVIVSNKALYYLDRSDKIIYNLTGEGDNPISEVLGIRSLMKSYGDITQVRTGYDPEYKEVLFYMTDETVSNNIVFNEYTNSFVSRYSFYPEEMYNVNDHFYSIEITPAATVARGYKHNIGYYGQFYGTTNAEIYDSFVDMIINPNGTIIDKYDTIDLRIDLLDPSGSIVPNLAMTSIEASNSYQTITKSINFSNSNIINTSLEETAKNLARKWRVWLLPDDSSTDFYRLTDSYLRLKIIRNNDFIIGAFITCDTTLVLVDSSLITCDMTAVGEAGNSYKFTLHDVTTFYRPTRN